MRFSMLGSGSGGNATLVEVGRSCVMIDCGLALPEAEARLERLKYSGLLLSGILVTHEHGDHLGGVARLARTYQVPVYLSPGSLRAWRDAPGALVRLIDPQTPFSVGEIHVQPVPVPHDAREPCHYVLSDGALRLGVLSDAGCVTQAMVDAYSACDGLLLEFNHDADMLANGPYSRKLKRRVAGPYGHLSNVQAATMLRAMDCSRLQHLVAIHLSQINNTPELARAAAAEALGCAEDWVQCAHQKLGLDWRELH